jgi:hypothetical protein
LQIINVSGLDTMNIHQVRPEGRRRRAAPHGGHAAGVGRGQRAGLRRSVEGDVVFNTRPGFPSGRAEIALLHYALDERLLDRLW